ncbi:RpiR family transcriptional regulator [Cryobacterium roopkundense]|uniref:RpiR family transcriptional regulator n=1 Tax=Cryobacterium roopkundense TaxID=1001240 RepID=A0A099JNT9_9MICO|nr:MurR/RpiR family transcriptional regulator [Cryobacterium roopkundense]KGJ79093.1 RpiR family transcriptional regulator [Cryobacterium roopkundense]MBB5643294.1 DNA-binding MurR/RpiR family transcriptional regulator [Cryobacterium roopkundense]
MSIQSTIHSMLPSMSPSIRRVADAILADPAVVLRQTISELAVTCSTSEPSVVRFCRTVGLTGYVQLRLELATEIGREAANAPGARRFGEDFGRGDSLADAVAKVRFTETMGIEETLDSLDMTVLDEVARTLDEASRILIYGVGAGAIVADDLRYKLFRIRRMAYSFDSAHEALIGASLMGQADVAIAFSHSGRTTETLEFLSKAREAGGTTIAVTNARSSPLTVQADHSLFTVVRETAFRSGAMASRIAQLALVDCMFVAVAQRSYETTIEALETTRQAVRGKKTPRKQPDQAD